MKLNKPTRRNFLLTSAATVSAPLFGGSAEAAPFRVAAIGHTGRGDFGHGMDVFWKSVPDTTFTAVSDRNPDGLRKALNRLDLPESKGFSHYKTMLQTTKPDLVSVCPRHVDQHHEMILTCIDSGVRGIYVEKPFCRDLAEADAIVEACEEKNVKLAIAHRNRYQPVLSTIRKLLADGILGNFLEVRARGKEDHRGGSQDLWVLGSHLLNLAHYFAGEPTRCSAQLYQDGRLARKDDVVADGAEGLGPLAGNEVQARYETESGVPIFFSSRQKAGNKQAGFGIQLIGTKGIIDLRADRNPLAHILQGNPFTPENELRGWVPISSAGIAEPEPDPETHMRVMSHVAAGEDLIAAIREDRPTLCDAEQGRTVTEMILAVFASHLAGGAAVEIPLSERGNPLLNWADTSSAV